MEDHFNPATLPLKCDLLVECDGVMVEGERHHVCIKAVPRQVCVCVCVCVLERGGGTCVGMCA